MPRIPIPDGDEMENVRLASLQPAIGNAIAVLAHAIYEESSLDLVVREAVRMRVAQINDCFICINTRFKGATAEGVDEDFYADIGNWRDVDRYDARTKTALEFTEKFVSNHLSINDQFIDRLGQYFSPTEIYELTFTIAGLLANGRIMQVLQIDQTCSLEMG